jgi:predicted DNA-binding transcriptional regulator AlpA
MIRKIPLAKKLGISEFTLLRWVRKGHFPPPIKLTSVSLVWRVADVEQWIREREAEQ